MATTVTLKPNAIDLSGSTSGTTTLQPSAVAGTTTITLPAATDTLVGKATTDTLTNKTLTAPTLASANITTALTLTGASGTNGQVLTSAGTGAAPTWSSPSTTSITNGTSNVTVNSSGGSITATTAGTAAVTIDTSQNVGIGTASPTNRLDIQAAKAKVFATSTTGTNDCYFAANNTGGAFQIGLDNSAGTEFGTAYAGVLYRSGAYPINFYTNGTERMRILSSGEVVIASTTSFGSGRLCVINDSTHHSIVSKDGGNNYLYVGSNSGGTQVFIVANNGNVTNTNNSYGAISDVKLKENIVDATPKLDALMQVKVRNYNLKSDPTHKQLGVIAQELEEIFPLMVEEMIDKDEECNELGTTTKSVKYTVFIPMLIKAIQELKAINDTQAEIINALTARIVALEAK
jgi:hypothetical protein